MINSTSIITLPLEKNVPNPSNPDWKLVQCPICGRNCWESELARKVKGAFKGMPAYCTECALVSTSSKKGYL